MGIFGSGRSPVVGGVIIHRDGNMVLAARRNYPAALSGRWELPGGKSKPRESPQETLRRELSEELGIGVLVQRKLSGSENIGSDLKLEIWVCRHTTGTPKLIEGHSEVRWLRSHQLWDVPWLDSNRRFVRQIPRLLAD